MKKTSGSTIIVVLGVVAVLTFIAGTAIAWVMNNRAALNQAVSWQEALLAAESGVHQATSQIQNQLIPLLNQTVPVVVNGSQTFDLTLNHSGEGNQTAGVQYVITGTYCTVSASGTSTRPYFRVVSTGSARVSGPKSFTQNSQDVVLRKLSLINDEQSATRQVEVWLRPSYSQDAALATSGTIGMNNHNITVDSFNSSDPNRSANGLPSSIIGFYNLATINKANGGTMTEDHLYANVGTNSTLAMLGGSYIYGNAMTNGGVVTNASNVLGSIDDDFSQPMGTVTLPNGSFSYPTATSNNSGSVETYLKSSGKLVLYGGSSFSPARYQLDSVALTGNGQLTFSLGVSGSASNPNLNTIELYIPGDFKTKGGGAGDGNIIIDAGVNVKIYVGGNIAIGGNGILNNNNSATTLSIQGITPLDGSTRTADFGGTSDFFGTFYGPAYDLTLGGAPQYVGSLVGKSATLVGTVNIRYDEALAGAGTILRYTMASWFENIKKVP